MLAGLTSRCSTPLACECTSASAIFTPTSRASTAPSGENAHPIEVRPVTQLHDQIRVLVDRDAHVEQVHDVRVR
jgi:hypothetical protein